MRKRLELAVQLALADRKERIELLKDGYLKGQRAIPLELYVDYHSRIFDALAEGPLTPTRIETLHKEHSEGFGSLRS